MRLAIASLFTLGLLFSFLFAILSGIAVYLELFSFWLVLGLVIAVNFIMWLISPRISDIVYSWFYDTEWITLDELQERSPEAADVITNVTREYGYSVPKLGVIQDGNPQAFTYGSGRWNSRILVTEGLFTYLDDNEVSSVYAHELGHITNRDFIIMTVANTIVQVLYLIAVRLYRFAGSGDSRDRSGAALVAISVMAYIFYFIGRYLVYYLSRVREYSADRFAGTWTHPNYLSSALIKISYGIMDSPDNEDLMKATESMGIMNLEQGEEMGAVYYNATGLQNWDPLAKAFLFDLKNPWASLLELKSTHPLTGKRVKALCAQATDPMFDFADLMRRFQVDTGRLWRNFARDLAVVGLPSVVVLLFPLLYLVGFVTESAPVGIVQAIGAWMVLIGLGSIIKTVYKYPFGGDAQETTVIDLLSDIYASPVRGSKTVLSGTVIGRGQAGFRFGEDLMLKDDTGLMYLRYQSWLPVFGNFWFGWRHADDLVDTTVRAKGWFLRGIMPWMGLRHIAGEQNSFSSWVHLQGYIRGVFFVLVGAALFLVAV